ncbi:MAG TPA: hypothetical protein VE987_17040 [Polyangiaceae bacterium]|nr:hypothetical protein [Polyangiaceae bacterium]
MNGPGDRQDWLEILRRDRETPAPEAAMARVATRLGIDTTSAASLPRGRPATAAKLGGAHIAGMLAAAFIAGGATGMLLQARLGRDRGARIASVHAPMPPAESTERSGATPAAPASPSAVDSRPSVASRPPPAATPATIVAAARNQQTQLDAERALLDGARGALVSGDSDAALRALDRHARTFRRPLLAEEHDALLVQALVRAGRYDEARARAEALRHKFPQSLLLPAVDAALASIP